MNDIKQFKLASGEEIICDVIEYPDEDIADMIVKNAYEIYMHGMTADGTRTYSMRPWMIMQDDSDNMTVINSNHVVGEANPSEKLIEHYAKVVMHDRSPETSADDMAEKLASFIKQLREAANDPSTDSDAPTNIVKFTGRVLH